MRIFASPAGRAAVALALTAPAWLVTALAPAGQTEPTPPESVAVSGGTEVLMPGVDDTIAALQRAAGGDAPAPDGDVSEPGGEPRGGICRPCDANCDGFASLADVVSFVEILVADVTPCSACAADLNGDGAANGADVQPFVDCLLSPPTGACCLDGTDCMVLPAIDCGGIWMGPGSACGGGICATGNLTAYRPQHGAGYFPFVKTAVPDNVETDPLAGPGIRVHSPGDVDPAGEDDLIELLVETDTPGAALALRRSSSSLRVWTTRDKQPDSELGFSEDRTGPLPIGAGQTSVTLFVEWATPLHGEATLTLEPFSAAIALDSVAFHTFRAIVVALGGESQVPAVPVDPNHGTFVVAIELYNLGYDVFMYDEDNVAADGSGPVLAETIQAIANRMVSDVAIFGYSHGGGSTHDLAERLDNDRAGIGDFEIVVTSYADGVQNDSDIDIDQETRRPPSTVYHANHYQVGTLSDFFLDGGPVTNSDPPPTGLNVETTPWGAGATHFTVDDYVQVRSFIAENLIERMAP